ncbi:MAG: hypothetical protein AAF688_03860 [Bacteroidota bacterium]
MSEKKNIDKLFKEQFKDFEAMPSDAVWKNIENELQKNKRKRRVIPIWWKVAGVAAVLALLFTTGNFILDDNNEIEVNENSIVDNEKTSTSDIEINGSSDNVKNEEISNVEKEERKQNSAEHFSKTKLEVNKNSEGLVSTTNETKNESSQNQQNKPQQDARLVTNDVDEVGKVNEANNLTNPNNYQKNANTYGSKTSVAQNDNNFNEEEKLKKVNGSKEALAATENLSKSNSKSNKNSENALIDASKADGLISKLKDDATSAVTDNLTTEKENSPFEKDSLSVSKEVNAIEEAIALANDIEAVEKEEEEKLNRWSVSPNVAPVYFNSLSQDGSSLDNQLASNSKQGQINMSYGIGGSYAINKKLKIRAGVNRVDLGYRTNDIIVLDNISPIARISQPGSDVFVQTESRSQPLNNVDVVEAHSNSLFISASGVNASTAPNQLLTQDQISLDQNLGFIEVPIEIEYSLLESKFGLNLIGGFSTLFLNNNEVFAVEDGSSSFFGEATNVNDMSYSANFGIGFNYNINEQFRFNLEPTFKYQINTFENTAGDFNPYFIGVYTGLSFKF